MNTDDATDIFINPFYAITIANHLFAHKPITAEEDWLLLNTALIEDIGMEQWLEELLDALALSEEKYDGHDIINPSTVVKLSESLRGKHETIVTRQEWVQANTKLAKELGVHTWLERLLETLRTGAI